MQESDEFRKLRANRGGVRPPRPVDVGAQLGSEQKANGAGQPARPRQAVHGKGLAEDDFFWSLSEKVGIGVGSVELARLSATCGWWGCENRSDDSIEHVLKTYG